MIRPNGFTLIELVAVLTLLGLLAIVALPGFGALAADAQQAQVAGTLASLRAGEQMVKAKFLVSGSPGDGANNNVTVMVEGVPVRFNNGEIRTTLNSAHVPSVPQNRNAAYTRLFFLFLGQAPQDIVARDSEDTGWAMLGNNNTCAAGANPRRCWEYRSGGARVARITYFTRTGEFVRD